MVTFQISRQRLYEMFFGLYNRHDDLLTASTSKAYEIIYNIWHYIQYMTLYVYDEFTVSITVVST